MKYLIFLRHGETGVIEREQQPFHDLNETGRNQIAFAAQRLKPFSPLHLYTSPYQRALSSAEVLKNTFDVPIKQDERLVETGLWLNPIDLEDDTHEVYKEALKIFQDKKQALLDFVDEIKSKEGNVVVVGHGNMIRVMTGALLKMSLDTIVRLQVHHASLTVFEYFNTEEENYFQMKKFNDTGDLE